MYQKKVRRMEKTKKYKCKNCNWVGSENEISYDEVETCFGDDKLEMCPKCGSISVFLMHVKDIE